MNQKYIKTLIDITLYLSCQGLPFRGHDESNDSFNKGNFKEACQLMSKHVQEFSEKFKNNTNYTNPLIQNNMIEICAKNVRNKIILEIGDGVFGIMCDEARCFKEEQMSLCVRYCKGLDINERFLGFIDCSESQFADSLSTHILTYLNCKIVKETRRVFHTLEALYIHFSRPTCNKNLIEMQNKLGIKKQLLTKLSDTRWNCRYQNCAAVKNCYASIVKTLKEEIDNVVDKDANEALGILTNMTKKTFVVHLIILHKVLSIINISSNQFQEKSATLGNTVNIIKSVIQVFENLRTSEGFSQIWTEIQTFWEEHKLISKMLLLSQSNKRQKFEPSNLEDFVLTTTTSAQYVPEDSENTEMFYRRKAFFPVLDSLIVNLKNRFSSESLEMALSVDNFFKLNFDKSSYFINHYKDVLGISIDCLKSEITVTKNCLVHSGKNEDFTIDDFKNIIKFNIYPNLYKLLQVATAIPISSATCERSFSAMKRIKIWLRTSMVQNRFNTLSILHIENQLSRNIDNEEILKKFAETNRMIKLN